MKQTTSDWFAGLDLRAMEDLVGLLFGLRGAAQKSPYCALYEDLLRRLDDEYHEHKNPPQRRIKTCWQWVARRDRI